MDKISVVLLNYKKSQDTIHCVKSLLDQNYNDVSIIVVDNSEEEKYINEIFKEIKNTTSNLEMISEKESAEFKNLEFKKDVVLIKANENRGFSAGNNIGIRLALKNNSDYVWILNNDTEVEKDTLEKMLEISIKSNTPVITCKMKDFYKRDKIQYDGEKISYLGFEDKYDFIKIPKSISGANLLIKSDVFKKTGLFDEDFFLYFEDNCFHYQLTTNKIPILYVPFVYIYHKGGSSIGRFLENPFSAYYSSRNNLLIENKVNRNKYSEKLGYLEYFYSKSMRSKKILKSIILGIYDYLKGKKGKQDKLDYFLNLKPDKSKINFDLENLEELYQKYPTNVYLNKKLSEINRNNKRKKIDYLFMLTLLYPRKEEYYKEFFNTIKDLLNNQEDLKNGKESISMYN